MSKYEIQTHLRFGGDGSGLFVVVDDTGETYCDPVSKPMARFYARMLNASDQQSALLKIANLLDGVEWDSGTLDTIAAICEEAGYQVRDIQDMG